MELNKKKNLAVIIGTRPNFIKAAPFLKRSKEFSQFKFTLINTGQHFDKNMSKVFFQEMEIPEPDISLNIRGELHTEKIGKMFNGLKKVLRKGGFDGAIVFGDVNSTLAGGIAAAKNNLKLIHIEAGLRSYDRRQPEEINRTIVDHLSDLLFTTEPAANRNLIKEGIPGEKIKYVGNILIEAMEIFWPKINDLNILNILGLKEKEYILVTVHRQENVDNLYNLKNILLILNEINKTFPIIFPLHPGTKERIQQYKLNDLLRSLKVINPLGYFEFMKLMINSKGVITDSGGMQDETSYLGIPCCTLRENTERPITVEIGSNRLFPPSLEVVQEIKAHLNRNNFRSKHIPLWDNKVSERIFNFLYQEYS
mgnify:CR=1 FL=1